MATSTGTRQDLGKSHTKLRHEPGVTSAVLKPCLLLVSLILPEQGGATEQEQTATSSLRASPFPKKPGTAQISPRLGASFAPHGMPCSGISKEKQKEKAAKCSRDLEAQTGLVLSCQGDGSSMEHTHPTPPPHQSCSPHPRTTLQVSWRNSPLLETSP